MISRKAATAAASTVVGLGAFAAVAISSSTVSNAGKTTPVAPVVQTEVKTKHKVVHVKPKPRRVTVAAVRSGGGAPSGSAARSASGSTSYTAPAAATALRQAVQVTPQTPTRVESEDSGYEDHGYEDDGRAREDRSHEDDGQETEGWDD